MIRAATGAIVGYAVMGATIVISMPAMLLAVDKDFVFDDSMATATTSFTVSRLFVCLLAGGLGGYIAAWIGGRRASRAVSILIGIIVLVGLLMSGNNINRPVMPPGVSVDDLSMFEAIQYLKSPSWLGPASMIVGVAATFVGGRLRGKQVSKQESA